MTAQANATQTLDPPLAWVDFDDVPIMFANHFLVQHQPNEFVLTLGQVTGPPLVGPPSEVRSSTSTEVPIATVARVGMTRHRMTELIALLQATLEDHDRVVGAS